MNAILRQVAITLENNSLLRYFAEVTTGACLLVAVALVLGAALRRQSASMRHGLWAAALVSLLVLSVAKFILPMQLSLGVWDARTIDGPAEVGARQPVPTGQGQEAAATDPQVASDPTSIEASVESTSPFGEPLASGSTNSPTPLHSDRKFAPITFQQAFIAVWFLGSISVLFPYVKSIVAIRRLIARSQIISSGPIHSLTSDLAARLVIRRRLAVCVSSDTLIPIVAGWRRPTIILPASSADWPLDRKRQVILHELAHVQRGDIAWALTARVACAVHWFNPLAWLVAGQLRREREAACDDVVLTMGEPANTYATNLLEIARASRGGARLLMAGTAMARSTNVRRRIVAILDDCRPRQQSRRVTSCVYFIAVIGMSLALAAVGTPRPADAQMRLTATAPAMPQSVPATTPNDGQPTAAAGPPARLGWQTESLPLAHRGAVWDLAFSPDGKLLATCAYNRERDKSIYLWELATGKLIRRLDPKNDSSSDAMAVAFSPDGKLIAGCWGSQGHASVWDVATGQLQFSIRLHDTTVFHLEFLPDSTHFVTGGVDGKIQVVRVADRAIAVTWAPKPEEEAAENRGIFGGGHPNSVKSLDVASDGKRILTVRSKPGASEFMVWQIGAIEPVLRIERPNVGGDGGRAFHTARFSPDGSRIISAGSRIISRENTDLMQESTTVRVLVISQWNATTGESVAEIVAKDVNGYGHLEISPDGRTLATDDFDAVHLWRFGEDRPFRRIPRSGQLWGYSKFSPDGRFWGAGFNNGVRVYELAKEEFVAGSGADSTSISAVAWSGDGSKVALSRGNHDGRQLDLGKVEIWDVAGRRHIKTFPTDSPRDPLAEIPPLSTLEFSPDGETVFSAGGTLVRQWRVTSGERLGEIKTGRSSIRASGLELTPDGRRAIVSHTRDISLHDLADGRKLAELPDLGTVLATRFSTDGQNVWVVDDRGRVFRWDPQQNTRVGEYKAEWRTDQERGDPSDAAWTKAAVFSPDARTLVTSHQQSNRSPGAVVFWDNELGQVIRVIRDQPVYQLAVSPDGKLLAGFEIRTSGNGRDPTNTIHIWDLNTGRELITLQPQDARATAIAFSPDSKQLLTGFDRGTFAIWDVR